jgi:hypothetical protein
MGDVQRWRWIKSKALAAWFDELQKGNRMCFPNWQAWHKSFSLLVQLIMDDLDKQDKASELGWPRWRCQVSGATTARAAIVP